MVQRLSLIGLMKPRHWSLRYLPVSLALASAIQSLCAVHAAELYFDANGSSTGSGASDANWDDRASNWSIDSNGSSNTQAWNDGDSATFSAGSDGIGSFTLQSKNVTVDNITQLNGRIRIANASLTLADTSMVVDTRSHQAGDYDLRIDSVLTDSREGASSITKKGPGILHLGPGTHSFSGGLILNAGTIAIEDSGTALGTGKLTLNGGNLIRSWGGKVTVATMIVNVIDVTGPTHIAIVQNHAGDIIFTGPWAAGTEDGAFMVGNTKVNDLAPLSATIQITGDVSSYAGSFAHENLDLEGNRLRFGATNLGNAGFNASKAKFFTSGSVTGINALDLADGTYGTFQMGELAGTGGHVRAGWSNKGNTTFEVGALNTASRFAGNLDNNPNGPNGLTALNKTGTGTFELSSSTGNNYSGGTTVNAGRLLVSNTSNSGTGGGPVIVGANGLLGGTGIIAPSGKNGISIGGKLAPGGAVSSTTKGTFRATLGTLKLNMANTSGVVQMLSGASLKMDLGSAGRSMASPGTNDMLAIAAASPGDLAFYNNTVDFGGTGEAGFYKLIDTSSDNSNTYTGLTFDAAGVVTSGLTLANLAPGLKGTFIVGTANNGTSGDLYLQVSRNGSSR